VYDLSYFFGFLVSMIVHVALHKLFPAKKQTGASPFEMELHRTIRVEGQMPQAYVESTTSHEEETVVVGKEKDGSV
jgi:NCS1 family nucleobase:cation symporter-1